MAEKHKLSEAYVELTAEDRGVSRAFSQWEGATEKLVKGFGRVVAAATSAQAIRLPFNAVTQAADEFERKMLRVQDTLGPKSMRGLDEVERRIKAISENVGAPATAVADAIARTNVAADDNVWQSIDRVGAALEFADAAGLEFLSTAEQVNRIADAYGLAANEVRGLTEALFTARQHAKGSFDELMASVARVAPIAAGAGVPLAEAAALIAGGTRVGLAPSDTTTFLEGFLRGLSKSSPYATGDEERVRAEIQASIRSRGLLATMQSLAAADLAKLGPVLPGRGGGPMVEQLGPALPLATAAYAAMQERTNNLMAAGARESRTYAGAMDDLEATFTNLKISVGEIFLPEVTNLIKAANEAIGPVRKWVEENERLVGSVGHLATSFLGTMAIAAGFGAALAIAGAAATFVFNPFSLVAIAIGAIGASSLLTRTRAQSMGEALVEVSKYIQSHWGQWQESMVLWGSRLIGVFATVPDAIVAAFSNLPSILLVAEDSFARFVNRVLDMMESLHDSMTIPDIHAAALRAEAAIAEKMAGLDPTGGEVSRALAAKLTKMADDIEAASKAARASSRTFPTVAGPDEGEVAEARLKLGLSPYPPNFVGPPAPTPPGPFDQLLDTVRARTATAFDVLGGVRPSPLSRLFDAGQLPAFEVPTVPGTPAAPVEFKVEPFSFKIPPIADAGVGSFSGLLTAFDRTVASLGQSRDFAVAPIPDGTDDHLTSLINSLGLDQKSRFSGDVVDAAELWKRMQSDVLRGQLDPQRDVANTAKTIAQALGDANRTLADIRSNTKKAAESTFSAFTA